MVTERVGAVKGKLCFLIGHSHQSFHCTAVSNKRFPQGDQGGNRDSRGAIQIDFRPRRCMMAFDFDWTGWSGWVLLESLDLTSVSTGPGAYVIAADRPITRAIGIDSEGFLDVGESGTLRKRLRDFKRCAGKRGEMGHMAGWRYAFFRFEKQFPLLSLQVRWVGTDTKAVAYRAEGRLLLTYLQRHCELPPLNYKFNWDVFEELGWNIFDDQPVSALQRAAPETSTE